MVVEEIINELLCNGHEKNDTYTNKRNKQIDTISISLVDTANASKLFVQHQQKDACIPGKGRENALDTVRNIETSILPYIEKNDPISSPRASKKKNRNQPPLPPPCKTANRLPLKKQ